MLERGDLPHYHGGAVRGDAYARGWPIGPGGLVNGVSELTQLVTVKLHSRFRHSGCV